MRPKDTLLLIEDFSLVITHKDYEANFLYIVQRICLFLIANSRLGVCEFPISFARNLDFKGVSLKISGANFDFLRCELSFSLVRHSVQCDAILDFMAHEFDFSRCELRFSPVRILFLVSANSDRGACAFFLGLTV